MIKIWLDPHSWRTNAIMVALLTGGDWKMLLEQWKGENSGT